MSNVAFIDSRSGTRARFGKENDHAKSDVLYFIGPLFYIDQLRLASILSQVCLTAMKLFGRNIKKDKKAKPKSSTVAGSKQGTSSPATKSPGKKANQYTPIHPPTVSLAGRNPVGRFRMLILNMRRISFVVHSVHRAGCNILDTPSSSQ